MGQRAWIELKKKHPYITWTERWPGPGIGRWWKRALSKSRRRYIKATLRGEVHPRTPDSYESECNYKTW